MGAGRAPMSSGCGARAPGLHLQGGSSGKWPGHGRADPTPGAAIAGGLRQPGGRGPAGESHRLRRSAPRGEHRRSGAHGISPGGQMSVLEI